MIYGIVEKYQQKGIRCIQYQQSNVHHAICNQILAIKDIANQNIFDLTKWHQSSKCSHFSPCALLSQYIIQNSFSKFLQFFTAPGSFNKKYLCSPLNLSICPKLLWCSGQPSNFLGRWYQFPLAPHESLIPNIWTTVSQNVVQGPDNICPYFSMFTFHLAVLRKNFPGGYLDIPDIGGLDSLW